jgi:hypothetical protein
VLASACSGVTRRLDARFAAFAGAAGRARVVVFFVAAVPRDAVVLRGVALLVAAVFFVAVSLVAAIFFVATFFVAAACFVATLRVVFAAVALRAVVVLRAAFFAPVPLPAALLPVRVVLRAVVLRVAIGFLHRHRRGCGRFSVTTPRVRIG